MASILTDADGYVDESGRTDAEIYLTDIYDGKIVACKEMKQLANMMLPRFHEQYEKWHYDVEKAIRPVRFIERYCCYPEGEKRGKPFITEQFQRASIELAFGFVDEEGYRQFRQVFEIIARKCGKALSLDTEIPTPDGWRRMADIHMGDTVFGQDGKPSTVVAESEIFDKPMYLVKFEDGSELKATDDHIWTVHVNGSIADKCDTTTEEMAGDFSPYMYAVPMCKPVEYSPKVPPDHRHPYDIGYDLSRSQTLPDGCAMWSVAQRMALLNGVVGYLDEHGILNPMFWDEGTADTFVELCASLGRPTCVYHDGDWTIVDIRSKNAYGNWCKAITSIKRIPNEPSKCIAIDNESKLYLAGRQYTATHNTSKLAAIMHYMLSSDSPRELGAEVYCCANSESQARKCYGAADAMREKSPVLDKHLRRGMVQKRGRTGIIHDKTGSFIYPLSSNVNKLDGLSASAVVYDEIMAATDNGALLDVLEESTSARRQPLFWCISTENHVRHNIGDDRMNYAKGILDGSVHDDRMLPIIYKMDSRDEIFDENMWVKANPGLGSIKSWDYLRDRVNKAKQSPSSMPSLLTKEFNLRSGAYSAYLDIPECINNTPIDFPISDVPYCIVGIDHGEKGDLAAAVARFLRPGDMNYYELARFWIPEKSVEINSAKDYKERDNVPYRQWAADGWVDIIPDVDRVNEMVFIDFLRELVDAGCYPFAVAYDQWRITEWADREMQRLVGSTRVVQVPQYPRYISPIMKEHRLDLRAKKVICPNPCLHHCRINVQARTDNNDNDFPQKKDLDHRHKIDGFMAELNCLFGFHKFEEEYLSAIGWYPPEGQSSPFGRNTPSLN